MPSHAATKPSKAGKNASQSGKKASGSYKPSLATLGKRKAAESTDTESTRPTPAGNQIIWEDNEDNQDQV